MFFFKNRDNVSRKIKAKDQYGTVLTLPKGMKPHMKGTTETTETPASTTAEVPSMFSCILFSFNNHYFFFSLR